MTFTFKICNETKRYWVYADASDTIIGKLYVPKGVNSQPPKSIEVDTGDYNPTSVLAQVAK